LAQAVLPQESWPPLLCARALTFELWPVVSDVSPARHTAMYGAVCGLATLCESPPQWCDGTLPTWSGHLQ